MSLASRRYDTAEIANLSDKDSRVYRRKFPKFEKAFRKRWAKDLELKGAYVLPDEKALAAYLETWETHF